MPHVAELHRHHTPQKLEELGRSLYRQKKYVEALEAFNASAQCAGATSLDLLDSRAATYEKLQRLDAALRDGRSMIEMSKGAVQGYLRTGKVLQAMEKADLALKIYQRGLRLVSSTSMNYELLHKLHDKLTRKLSAPDAKDILAILPVELIEMIFLYLPFKQLCKCLRVSKHWKTLLTAWPCFWAKVDFSGSRKPIRERTIKSYIGYSKKLVTEAKLNCSDLQASKVLDILFQNCKGLSSTSIMGGGLLGESLVRTSANAKNLRTLQTGPAVVVSQDTAMRVMSNLPNLEEVRFGNVTQDPYPTPWPTQNLKLRSFTIHLTHPSGRSRPTNVMLVSVDTICVFSSSAQPDLFKKEICPQSSSLEILNLESEPSVDVMLGEYELGTNLKELCIHGMNIIALPHGLLVHLPNSLRKLSLRNTNSFKSGRLPETAIQFPDLETFVVAELHQTDLESMRMMLSREGSRLHEFAASSSFETTEEMMRIVVQERMKQLKVLDLSGSEKLGDKEVIIVADSLRQLISVNLSGTQITGVGVKKLVQSLPKLRRLVLRDCAQISTDAVAWARQQKLEVVYHCKSL